jgi:hypothetical protein
MSITTLARNVGIFCYVEWGLIHLAACSIYMKHTWQNDGSGLPSLYPAIFGGASDAIVADFRSASFPPMSNRLLLQLGMSLGFAGAWSLMTAYVAYQQQPLSRYVWLLTVPVLTCDICYFTAIDTVNLGDHMAEAQTFICSIGSALLVYDLYKQGKISGSEASTTGVLSLCLAAAGAVCAVYYASLAGGKTEL